MKHFRIRKFACISFLTISLLVVSCKQDKTDDPTAPSPTTDARDKYVGKWLCNENSKVSGTTSYTINISKSSSSSSEILIDHFYDLQAQARAGVSNNNISIPYQQLGTIGFASGSGNLSSTGTSLSMTYTTNIAGNRDSCTATCSKQ
ncbi:MAG: hypothetical protein V4506_08690 [Bacteroidota bacterium]